MRFSELKIGTKVVDRWWGDWGVGRVIKVLKTRATIAFSAKSITYDKAHVQFLEPV